MDTFNENCVYAGINGYGGYVPLLPDLIRGCGLVFILKGTPGCGKSTLMKRLCARAERTGKEYAAVRCSADTNSLDAVIFPESGIAVADGTAPHVLEPSLPLVNGVIVDLTGEYTEEFRATYGERLRSLDGAKKKAYAEAYSLLSAAGRIDEAMKRTADRAADAQKAASFAERTVRKYAKERGGAVSLPCACFNGNGFSFSLPSRVRRLTVIKDFYGISGALLKMTAEKCADEKRAHTVIPSPVDPDTPCGVILGENAYVSDRYFSPAGETSVNARRFADKELYNRVKAKLAFLEKLYRELISRAAEYMREASGHHESMEKIYALDHDFSKADKAYIMLCENVFGE